MPKFNVTVSKFPYPEVLGTNPQLAFKWPSDSPFLGDGGGERCERLATPRDPDRSQGRTSEVILPLASKLIPGPPKYVKSWPLMAVIMGLGLLFYMIWGLGRA